MEMVEEEKLDEPSVYGGFSDDATGAPPSSPLDEGLMEPGRPGGRSEPGE